eukprot:5900739-Ditylum_brightwellii.AAC.1
MKNSDTAQLRHSLILQRPLRVTGQLWPTYPHSTQTSPNSVARAKDRSRRISRFGTAAGLLLLESWRYHWPTPHQQKLPQTQGQAQGKCNIRK